MRASICCITLAVLVLAATAVEVAAARPSGEAAKRRRLSALETSQAPSRNVTTRGITDCLFEHIENGVTAGTGRCMYGRYCGGCDGKVDGEPAKASPIDALDRACFFHDKCYTGDDSCRECYCNALLGDVARQVWEAGKEAEGCGCGLFQRGCSNAVMEAGSVYQWIDKLTYSKNCPDECADAPEVDQCSATVMYETDLYGGDYRDVSISDWHECCKLCASLSDCRAWTYTNGRCYMKDDSWSAEAREGLISGYK